MSNPTVALITVAYNSEGDLKQHWSKARDLGVEWVVVDNASVDDSAAVAEKLGARVLRLPKNVGFSAANNAAAATVSADCLIFVNPDVTADRDGIHALARRAMTEHAIVAPQLVNEDGSDQENGRAEPYLYRKFLHFFGARASRREYEVTAAADEIREVVWAIGAAVAVPSTIFEEIGGWDAGFFIYYEDSDICLRAKASGYATFLDGNVRWKHGWARATRRSISYQIWRIEIASAWRFYRRYPWLLLHPRLTRRATSTKTI